MGAASVFNSTNTNPGGTGTSITVTLPTHAVNDVIHIFVGNTGNTAWTAPSGWNLKNQTIVGSSANGVVGTLLWRKVLSGDSLQIGRASCRERV